MSDFRNVPDPLLAVRDGVFVAEGRLVVRRLLETGALTTRSVMVTAAALDSIADVIAPRPAVPVYLVSQRVMDRVTGFNIHRGCLAIGVRPARRTWQELTARRLVVLERVGNADNVGGVFRNAAALGADAVLVGPACADPLYRKAIRTSMGASLTTPFASAEPWPDALHGLRDAGWVVIGLVPSSAAPVLHEVVKSRAADDRVALVLGHEGDGLTREALDACSCHARIPISEAVDSLNVATAAGIALYELTRLS